MVMPAWTVVAVPEIRRSRGSVPVVTIAAVVITRAIISITAVIICRSVIPITIVRVPPVVVARIVSIAVAVAI
jgi:hypothetical protein